MSCTDLPATVLYVMRSPHTQLLTTVVKVSPTFPHTFPSSPHVSCGPPGSVTVHRSCLKSSRVRIVDEPDKRAQDSVFQAPPNTVARDYYKPRHRPAARTHTTHPALRARLHTRMCYARRMTSGRPQHDDGILLSWPQHQTQRSRRCECTV